MIWLWVVLAVLVIIGISLVLSYNRFVSQRQLVRNSWANIDTELRRRYDLIPNLVETVKGYAAHEREVFEDVARTRSAAAATTGSPAQQAAAEGPFVAALGRLFAVAENYPELKANENFKDLQSQLSSIEEQIKGERNRYNERAQAYNTARLRFPASLIASLTGFGDKAYFKAEAGAEAAPKVQFGASPAPAPAPSR
jgi:LemA protein